jgi:hypothetical protein
MDSGDLVAVNRAAIDAIRVRRDALYEGVLNLERALAAPIAATPTGWAARVGEPLRALQATFGDHVHGTEAPGGFFDDVTDLAPGLAHAAERLKSEHGPLQAALAGLGEQAAAVTDEAAGDAVRAHALDVVRALLEHRHRGAELVFDAYNVDVATGD